MNINKKNNTYTKKRGRDGVPTIAWLQPIAWALAALGVLSGVASMLNAAENRLPNIVFLLADDLGYGDLHCYGHPYARTPYLDRLAKEGTRFNQFYVTGITCCPSRTGFMTSKFPATFAKYPAEHGFGNRITVTQLMKQAGYVTGHFGKWHMGPEQRPGTYGIDEIQGDDDAGRNKRTTAEAGRDAHIYEAATRFIEQHRDQPFYLHVWGHISHFPVSPSPALAARFKDIHVRETDFGPAMQEKFAQVRELGGDVDAAMRNYLGEVSSLDDAVGRLLNQLDRLGLSRNTIVVFSSDHGPAPVTSRKESDDEIAGQPKEKNRNQIAVNMLGSPGPFRGGKHEQLEGGIRVPFLVRWPEHVPAGRVDDQSVISGIDWLPTLCALTEQKLPHDNFDGENVLASWLGKSIHNRTKPLLWKTSSTNSEIALRAGSWKLHLPHHRRGEIQLYNIPADPTESNNLAKHETARVARLQAIAESWKLKLPTEYDKSTTKED
jgi:arylsulfatase A-like enzyme